MPDEGFWPLFLPFPFREGCGVVALNAFGPGWVFCGLLMACLGRFEEIVFAGFARASSDLAGLAAILVFVVDRGYVVATCVDAGL